MEVVCSRQLFLLWPPGRCLAHMILWEMPKNRWQLRGRKGESQERTEVFHDGDLALDLVHHALLPQLCPVQDLHMWQILDMGH